MVKIKADGSQVVGRRGFGNWGSLEVRRGGVIALETKVPMGVVMDQALEFRIVG